MTGFKKEEKESKSREREREKKKLKTEKTFKKPTNLKKQI